MKKFLTTHSLRLVLLIVAIKWTLSGLVVFNLKQFKPSHMISTYEQYSNLMSNIEESSIQAREEFKAWWKNRNVLSPDTNRTSFLCLAIMTRDRIGSSSSKPVNHLNKIVMSLLTRTKLKHHSNIKLVVYNTQNIYSDNLNQLGSLLHVRNLTKNDRFRAGEIRLKEALDYAFILRDLSRLSCEYILISEDDVIFGHDWFDHLKQALNELRSSEFFVVKIFTGYKMFDWTWLYHPQCVIEVLFWSFVTTVLSTMALYAKKLDSLSIWIIVINSIGLMSVLRALSTSPVASYTPVEYNVGFSCVSVVYPNNKKLLDLARYIESKSQSADNFLAKDLQVESFREETGYKEYIVEPSLVQHIGMHSSLYRRDLTEQGYKKMFKSYSFMDFDKLVRFDLNYLFK